VLIAPLAGGVVRRVKERLQSPEGARCCRAYRDLAKLLRKGIGGGANAYGCLRPRTSLIFAWTWVRRDPRPELRPRA